MEPLTRVLEERAGEVRPELRRDGRPVWRNGRVISVLDRLSAANEALRPGFRVLLLDGRRGTCTAVLSRTLVVEVEGERDRALVPVSQVLVDRGELIFGPLSDPVHVQVVAGARGRANARRRRLSARQVAAGWGEN